MSTCLCKTAERVVEDKDVKESHHQFHKGVYKLDTKQFSVQDKALKSIHGDVPRHKATVLEILMSQKHNKSQKMILTSVFETKH